ncbi:ornithine cyclodeaminase family protein [Arthrobacter sp. ISL-28]|uniref:ornithine cyclodeaminase family protein n=1 Tax=Arthrobacter sp. ISL-28 TaxID=2819108 RepID=UPI001BE7F271|nr:ornithine cyclodeaminase family protein [Arthrobacter sp. ISL-28]MBT2523083.1 ornithine cyclodeaminase family protein [Arthrobacter sp. ISL-28]
MPLMQSDDIAVVSAEQVFEHLTMERAISALERALKSGLKPEDSLARSNVPLAKGSFLLMPGEHGGYAGVKIVTVAPENHKQQLPKIQGNYLLFNSDTLHPLMLLDGVSLTAIRTSALSALAIRHLAATDAASLLVFGTGPQALYHVKAVAAVRHLTKVTVVGRSVRGTEALLAQLRNQGFNAHQGTAADVAEADIITCCTSAREPLFDGSLVRDDAVVVAMGSHEPDAREVDDALLKRSTIYVEDTDTALREAGDIIIGIHNGTITGEELHQLSPLVRVGAVPRRGPAFFKSVGMGWQDLVTASAIYEDIIARPSDAASG